MSCMNITDLPDECLWHILSLTSPSDVIRSSVVSKQFLSVSVSDSDAVWTKFLPSNFDEIVLQSSTPLLLQQFNSKKQLYLHLCSNPILYNGDTQSFALNQWNGKKCYMLGARALNIVWGDTPRYWNWTYLPESRFREIAELLNVCWLLIEANVNPKILSPNTTYGAYFVYKLDVEVHRGFEHKQVKVFMFEVPEEDESSKLPPPSDVPFKQFYLKAPSVRTSLTRRREELPDARDDGWMEIEMGRYYVNDSVDESLMLRMTLTEVEELHWKSGLIVYGIELRPLD